MDEIPEHFIFSAINLKANEYRIKYIFVCRIFICKREKNWKHSFGEISECFFDDKSFIQFEKNVNINENSGLKCVQKKMKEYLTDTENKRIST